MGIQKQATRVWRGLVEGMPGAETSRQGPEEVMVQAGRASTTRRDYGLSWWVGSADAPGSLLCLACAQALRWALQWSEPLFLLLQSGLAAGHLIQPRRGPSSDEGVPRTEGWASREIDRKFSKVAIK